MNRLEHSLDGFLHLMDRQVVDTEGLMVCKCDDLELEERDDGTLVVTALLVGPAVWVPRLGAWLGERWRRLGAAQSDRLLPYRLDLADVAEVTQEIRLSCSRDGALRRQDPHRAVVRRLVDALLHAEVLGPGGEHLGNVLDVRLAPSPGAGDTALVLTHLLVGRGRPGSYLGYDRRSNQGPWLVRRMVRCLHRDSGMVDLGQVRTLDWDGREVHVESGLSDLTSVRTGWRTVDGEADHPASPS